MKDYSTVLISTETVSQGNLRSLATIRLEAIIDGDGALDAATCLDIIKRAAAKMQSRLP